MDASKDGPPRLRVGLRRGTRYRFEEDGRNSEPSVLAHDIEADLLVTSERRGEYGVYLLDDGRSIYVLFQDEVRG